MQQDQIKGALDRAITVLVTMLLGWMVKKGWIGESDSAALLPAIVLLPAVLWGLWVNRTKAILQSAAAVPGTVVVTTPALARATPDDKNIVSSSSSAKAISEAVTEQAAAANTP